MCAGPKSHLGSLTRTRTATAVTSLRTSYAGSKSRPHEAIVFNGTGGAVVLALAERPDPFGKVLFSI